MEPSVNKSLNSYLSFKIGNELYAASVDHVISILEISKITRVPKAPAYMKGVINVRGSVLPVLDTRVKFNTDKAEFNVNTCILILEISHKNETLRLGAIVDSVQEVLQLEQEDIQPPPTLGTDFNSDIITGMAKPNDEFIMILNVAKLFNEESMVEIV